MREFHGERALHTLRRMLHRVTWQCQRCWGEQHKVERPRCRHCNTIMVKKDDPDDAPPAVDLLADLANE